jgi:SAM-dependent methyltransferase
MHREAYRFVETALADHDPTGKDVVELGSFIVNGTIRPLFFECCWYEGVDVRAGDGVTVVCDAAKYKPGFLVDIVVTTEMLEHSPNQKGVIANVAKILKPGGVFILTAAGVERPPHNNDGNHGIPEDEFYKNISEEDLAKWLTAARFANFTITRNEKIGDIYCVAIR